MTHDMQYSFLHPLMHSLNLPNHIMSTPSALQFQETALDWWQRSEQCRHRRRQRPFPSTPPPPPTTPTDAAWAFLEGRSGISYMDAAWQRSSTSTHHHTSTAGISGGGSSSTSCSPIVVLEGAVAKTWTLRSLAARFVVATRPSRFAEDPRAAAAAAAAAARMEPTPQEVPTAEVLPQVIVLDSQQDFGIPNSPALTHVVRSTLLRQQQQQRPQPQGSSGASSLDEELQECLERIHICATDNASGWVPILEVLRQELSSLSPTRRNTDENHGDGGASSVSPRTTTTGSSTATDTTTTPILILWDGFLQEPTAPSGTTGTTSTTTAASSTGRSREDTSSITKTEIMRQLARLLQACPHVSLVVTTTTTNGSHTNNTAASHANNSASGGGTTATNPTSTAISNSNSNHHHHYHYHCSWISTLTAAMTTSATTRSTHLQHHHQQQQQQQKRMFHRIVLERRSGKDCVATVLGGGGGGGRDVLQQFSFSLSLGGILS